MSCPAGAYTFQGRDGELHILDNSNNMVVVKFEQMDLTGPISKPRPPDPTVVTVGGYVMAPTGPDYDQVLYDPVAVTFSLLINSSDTLSKIIPALCNPLLSSPWQVGNVTWASTKARGSIILFDGTYAATQPFFDTKKVAVMFESKWTASNGSVFAMQWDEVYVPPQNIELVESNEFVILRIQALVYGNIAPITAFTSGTPS